MLCQAIPKDCFTRGNDFAVARINFYCNKTVDIMLYNELKAGNWEQSSQGAEQQGLVSRWESRSIIRGCLPWELALPSHQQGANWTHRGSSPQTHSSCGTEMDSRILWASSFKRSVAMTGRESAGITQAASFLLFKIVWELWSCKTGMWAETWRIPVAQLSKALLITWNPRGREGQPVLVLLNQGLLPLQHYNIEELCVEN